MVACTLRVRNTQLNLSYLNKSCIEVGTEGTFTALTYHRIFRIPFFLCWFFRFCTHTRATGPKYSFVVSNFVPPPPIKMVKLLITFNLIKYFETELRENEGLAFVYSGCMSLVGLLFFSTLIPILHLFLAHTLASCATQKAEKPKAADGHIFVREFNGILNSHFVCCASIKSLNFSALIKYSYPGITFFFIKRFVYLFFCHFTVLSGFRYSLCFFKWVHRYPLSVGYLQ